MHQIFLAFFLLIPPTGPARSSVEIVLDASAATGRSVGAGTIHDMVREAVVTIVAETVTQSDGPKIGLRTAGGSSNLGSPCTATTLDIPVGEPDREQWDEALEAVEPRGPRPLNHTVVAAIKDIAQHGENARIVIVTAGADECDFALSEVATSLATAPNPVEIRIVGLNLGPETEKGFGAMALKNATNPTALLESLRWAILGAEDPTDSENTPETTPTEPPASVSVPPRITAGETFDLDWVGPEDSEDFLSLAPAGSPDDEYLEWARTDEGNPTVFRAPDTPGAYEVRYVDGASGKVRAHVRFKVAAIPVNLKVPASAVAGRRFEIIWTGPARPGDFLAISRAGVAPDHYHDWASTINGSPLSLAAPFKPGTYEVRYISGSDLEIAAHTTIEVRR